MSQEVCPDSPILLLKLFFPSLSGTLAGACMYCTYMAGYLCNDFYSDSWEDQQQSGVCQGQSVLAPGVTKREVPRSNSQTLKK